MQIDWFTFFAQIINFLILLALLKRFLYRPILQTIADRETEIAARFEQAQQQQDAASKAQREFDSKTEELTHARQKLLAEAAHEAEAWKAERLAEAKSEVDTFRSDWFMTLEREREQLRDNVLSEYRRHALSLAEGIIGCLTDADGQQAMVSAFIRQLKTAPAESHATLKDAQSEPIVVRTAFPLSTDQQNQLRAALSDVGCRAEALQFRMDESLICGIEVRTPDHELSWNARESLDFMMTGFSRELDEILALPEGLTPTGETSDAS
ncbi:MAG: F0F1 ATP synthase subunit delta [Planctomycetota bacterium]|jgi:F-type H+-transporting ATPase subunit b